MKSTLQLLLIVSILLSSCKSSHKKEDALTKEDTVAIIETSFGNITVKLFNETPIHRDNFIKLANEGVYNGTIFHRVINTFMIQGGDPQTSSSFNKSDSLRYDYTLNAEFNPKLFNKKGALAAARMGDNVNPEKKSSSSQFYIVQGKVFNENDLNILLKRKNDNRKNIIINTLIMKKADEEIEKGNEPDFTQITNLLKDTINFIIEQPDYYFYTEDQVKAYTSIGGTPHLDGDYTVFGEVIEGFEVIDKIASVKTGQADRPIEDITMKVKILTK